MAERTHEPLHADSWYQEPPVDEVRREVQRLYDLINELEDRIAELESA